jgi:GntR family transcriptional repressor for pyruvate dehydrogenase complex
LRIKQGDGTYVNRLDIDTMMSKIAPNFLMDEKSLLDMVEVRMTIEQDTAHIAAQRIDEEHASALQSIVDEMGASLGDPPRFMDLDFKFHYEIAKATKNSIFTQLILFIQDTMQEQQKRIAQKPAVTKVSYEYHKKICSAIINHEADLARSLMREHLQNVPFRFLESVPASLKKTIEVQLPHTDQDLKN